MNTLSPLGLISCFLFYLVLNGTSLNEPLAATSEPYIVNHSKNAVYFKPESRKDNPGLDPYAAYAIAPGEAYHLPFDAVVTSSTQHGQIYRVPSGSKIVIDADGIPRPANIIARAGMLVSAYGEVTSPCIQFDKLANPKGVLIRPLDLTR